MSARSPAPVLYVTYDGLLEPLGASQVVPYVRGLAERGYAIEVLSFEKPADLADRDRVRALQDDLEGAGVAWTRLRYHKRPSLPATAWDVASGRRYVARRMAALRRAGRPGLVHARGYLPGLMGLAGGAQGARLLFDMRGFWVDERIEGGYWAPGSLHVRLGRRLERRLLREADHLVLLTSRAAEGLEERAGGARVPNWTVVPTCVDLERFRAPADRSAARRRLGVGRAPVLVHVGTLTGWYDGHATMEVARAFLARTGGTFVVLTRDRSQARRLAEAARVDALVTTAAPEDVPLWLQAADAGLALVRPSPSKDASFPTKIAEYLACGLAVLSTPIGDLPSLADGELLGLLRPGDAPAAAAAWLARAVCAPGRAERARALAEAHLGVAGGVARLAEVYASLGVEPEAPE